MLGENIMNTTRHQLDTNHEDIIDTTRHELDTSHEDIMDNIRHQLYTSHKIRVRLFLIQNSLYTA